MHRGALVACLALGVLTTSCAVGTEDGLSPASGRARDASIADADDRDDAGVEDGAPEGTSDGALDAGSTDAAPPEDASPGDASLDSAGPGDGAVVDTGTTDTGTTDTGTPDTGTTDTGVTDGGALDAGGCPVLGCVNGSESRAGCANARTIGRTTAASSSGYKVSDDTCYASNHFTDSSSSCWGSNADHAYRLWMKAGEKVSLQLSTSWPCSWDLWDWYASLKIFESSGCDDKACGARTLCSNDDYLHSRTFVAPRDGWYVFVVDGASSWDDQGDYTFTVKLTCNEPDCGC